MGRFLGELRDAITGRAFLLVLGVLLLQLGFIASYLAAFHQPTPRDIPLAVVAPAPAAEQLVDAFNQLDDQPVDAEAVQNQETARDRLATHEVYGVFIAGSGEEDQLLVAGAAGSSVAQALTTISRQVSQAQGRTLTVEDVVPVDSGDARGLSGFYLVVGWVVGGYLVAAILGLSVGARPVNTHRGLIRLGALAVYAVVSGLGGALITEIALGALSGHLGGLWALGALLVFAVSSFTMAMQILLGIPGIGLAILLFVILGNPSAGGAYPATMLPPFFKAIGPWLPTGAATSSVRDIVYFPKASITQPLLVLAGYALVGVVITVVAARMKPRPARDSAAAQEAEAG